MRLHRFDRHRGALATYRHDPADPDSLGDDLVRAIGEDREGRLWIGTDEGGLDRLDRRTVRRAVRKLSPILAERGVRLEIADDLPVVMGDVRSLAEAVCNLLGNAVKFLGDVAEPRVEQGGARTGRPEGSISFGARLGGPQ